MCLNNKSLELHSGLRNKKESFQEGLVLNGKEEFKCKRQWSSSETQLLFVISLYY